MKIKGTVINARKEFIKEHFGEYAWEKVMNTLPPSHQDKLRGTILCLPSAIFTFQIGSLIIVSA